MPAADTALISAGSPATRFQIAVMNREPLGIPFTIDVAAVTLVDQVTQLVDQNVVKIEILGSLLAPSERPQAGPRFGPTAAVHFGFVYQIGPRWRIVRLYE